ncbi:hypothetical protein [Vibrio sp. S234-5]|uniref:hypothetical protein n=1 Tax=Vibrio sp. S234-5 TaxID=1616781 RepID=UPI0005EFCD8D|nr:hypothetical protein [Vibrio sp. S234-5]KJR37661.1 hypothetical protein UF06_03730 [Vibrio sp. S234-5]
MTHASLAGRIFVAIPHLSVSGVLIAVKANRKAKAYGFEDGLVTFQSRLTRAAIDNSVVWQSTDTQSD